MPDQLTLLCVLGGAALAVMVAIVFDPQSRPHPCPGRRSPMSTIADKIAGLLDLLRQFIGLDAQNRAEIDSLRATIAQRDARIAQLEAQVANDAATAADYQALQDAASQIEALLNSQPEPTDLIAKILAIRDKLDAIEVPKPIAPPPTDVHLIPTTT